MDFATVIFVVLAGLALAVPLLPWVRRAAKRLDAREKKEREALQRAAAMAQSEQEKREALQRPAEVAIAYTREAKMAAWKRNFIIIFAVLVVAFALTTWLSSGSKSVPQVTTGPLQSSSLCADNYKACSDNAAVINNYRGIGDAQFACKTAVDDHVKYGSPDWSWLYQFGKFYGGDDFVKTGIIRIIDDTVKIQNMYGAMEHSQVECEYDLNSKKVLQISINGSTVILSAPAITPPTGSTEQSPSKVIDDYARSEGITVDQLESRIGRSHSDLIVMVGRALDETPPFDPTVMIRALEKHAAERDRPLETTVTSVELVTAYREDRLAADANFKGRRFQVTGTVTTAETLPFPIGITTTLNLDGGTPDPHSNNDPQFYLSPVASEQFVRINKGDEVTLNCTGNGSIGDGKVMAIIPVSEYCSLQSSAPKPRQVEQSSQQHNSEVKVNPPASNQDAAVAAIPKREPSPLSTSARQYWYYCKSAGVYYPYVTTCVEPWLTVDPATGRQVATSPAAIKLR